MKILLLFCFLALPYHDADCFNLLYTNGLKAYNNRQFSTALQKFTAARACPDKPAATDLEDWIRRSQENLDERKAWNRARNADTAPAYERYMARYPDGYYRAKAADALRGLQQMAARPVQETNPSGSINWTQEYVEARGECAIDRKRFPDNEAQAVLMATRGAEVVAKANLLETAGGVQLQRTTRVKDLMTESDVIQTKVEGIVKGARLVGEPKVANGVVAVILRMPVLGQGSVAELLLPGAAAKPMADANHFFTPDTAAAELVFRLTATNAHPILYPSFVDENGMVLLDGPLVSGQRPNLPVVRYIHPDDAPPATRPVDVAVDTAGRWVLPAPVVPQFKNWLLIRASEGETVPIRVIL